MSGRFARLPMMLAALAPGWWLAGSLVTVAPTALGAPPPGLAGAARAILGADQGVYVEAADGRVLLAQNATTAVQPASVSKVPTTLALLRKLGPEHRFITTFSAQGRLLDGTLHGELVVSSDGDPSFVDEDALLVAQRLNSLGIRRIAGTLRASGPLTFDWRSDADGTQLRRALSGLAPPAAWSAVRALELPAAEPAEPAVQFVSASGPGLALRPVASGANEPYSAARIVLVYRSQPLLPLLKSLDDYSNNIVAPLAEQAGGAAAVQDLARDAVPPAMRAQIILGDGAGADPRNRLSPRAAVKLLRALEQQLAVTGHTLPDVLPVSGVDEGTLHDRLNGPAERGRVVGKTGTFGSYGASALVGAIRTRKWGTVYFAVLDHGVPVPEARRRQDRFVRALLQRLHTETWNYRRDAQPAVARAQIAVLPGAESTRASIP